MGVLVLCILLVVATLLCWNAKMVDGEAQEKGGTAALVWIGPEIIFMAFWTARLISGR